MKNFQINKNINLFSELNNSCVIVFLFFFSFPFPFILFGQSSNNSTQIDLKVNGSYAMPHHKKMAHLTESHFLFYELSYIKKTDGSKFWHQLYNYPTYGLTFQYNNLGSSEILGNAYCVYPFMSLPLIENNIIKLDFKFGSGLAYLTKKFDKDINYKNVAISTNLNLCINFSFELSQKINSYFSIYEGINITHFSNGALKMPNTGINLPSLAIGFRYSLSQSNKEILKSPVLPNEGKVLKKYFFSMTGAFGFKEIYPPYGQKYPAFSLYNSFNIQPSLKRIFNLNLDLFYSLSSLEKLKRENIKANKFSIIKPGLSMGYELIFGKTNFALSVGRYLYAKDDSGGYIYNRVGFKKFINNNIFLNLSLKSHLLVADYIEWGCGYKF